MTKHKFTEEQLRAVERIRSTMAIEGYEQTAEAVRAALDDYFVSGEDEVVEALVCKARKEGRPYQDVLREHFGPPAPRKPNA